MKTRKHRKWYQLTGMKRHGKFETVIERAYAVYHVDLEGIRTIATGPYIVCCRGQGIAVSKEVARATAGFDMKRLYVMAVDVEDVEAVRLQLEAQSRARVGRWATTVRSIHLDMKLVR